MRLITTAFLTALLAIGLSYTAPPVHAQGQKEFIAIGTGGPTGVYFVVGNAICRMVHKEAAEGRKEGRKHGIRCAAPSTGGSIYNINNIASGELDFGVAQSDWQFHAYEGDTPDRIQKFDKLRAVFSVHPEPFQILAGKDSGIKSWDDLEGKRVNIGNPGSGQRALMDLLIAEKGWTNSDFALAAELAPAEQASALCDNNIDAFAYTVGHPAGAIEEATTT